MIPLSKKTQNLSSKSCIIWFLGLILCNTSRHCAGFIAERPLNVRLSCPGHLSTTSIRRKISFEGDNKRTILCAQKGVKWDLWAKIFRRERKKKLTSRTSSYLATLDKRRGYHRKSLGGIAQIVNNTDINVLNPEKVAGAIVGRISSAAFKYVIKPLCVYKRMLLLSVDNVVFRDDIKRRSKVYASDWTDAFKDMNKVVPAVLFLYFACLSPAVSFGTIASQITNGSIGIVEFLVSCGCSGMVRFHLEIILLSTTIGLTSMKCCSFTPSSVDSPCHSLHPLV